MSSMSWVEYRVGSDLVEDGLGSGLEGCHLVLAGKDDRSSSVAPRGCRFLLRGVLLDGLPLRLGGRSTDDLLLIR